MSMENGGLIPTFQVFFVSVVRKGEYLTRVMQSSSLDMYYLKTYIPDNGSLHPKH